MQVAMPELLPVRLGCVAQLFSFVVNILGSVGFFNTTWMSEAVPVEKALCVHAGGAWALWGVVLLSLLAVAFCWLSSVGALASRRRFLAMQFFCRWAFVSRAPFTSAGLSSKIVCSIVEKVA